MRRILLATMIMASSTNLFSKTINVDWYCFDKNIGMKVIVYDAKLGDIEFRFLNVFKNKGSFRTTCQTKETNDQTALFHCRQNSDDDFGFFIYPHNPSVMSGIYTHNHREFSQKYPSEAREYDGAFLVCEKNVEIYPSLSDLL